jgi:transposase
VRASTLTQQFATVLQQVHLPAEWQPQLVMRCRQMVASINSGSPQERRQALEAEQSRLIQAYRKGYIDDACLGEQIGEIRTELAKIPMALIHDLDSFLERAQEVADLLGDLADYWHTASMRRQHEIVAALLMPGGVVYDLQRQLIIGLRPRPEAQPALELALGDEWERGDDSRQGFESSCYTSMLWLKPEHYDRHARRSASEAADYQPAQRSTITQEQRAQALALLNTDQSLRQIADQVGISYWAVLRLAQRFADPNTQRPSHQRPKLSDGEQQTVLGLLASGMSLRAVAKQFGVSYASIDRIQRRHRTQQSPQAPLDGSAADAANGPVEPEA